MYFTDVVDANECNGLNITKYERARAIGVRARQISEGSPVHVAVDGLVDELDMATKEYDAGKSPLIVRRLYPDHTSNNPHFDDIVLSSVSHNRRYV